MRYSEIDLQCEDIMWFGVDKIGAIFECTTGGIGNVPEFVCMSKETNETLCDYFVKTLSKSTSATLLCEYDEDNELLKDCIGLSEKGIVCYDISEDDEKEGDYVKISVPEKNISIESLPNHIKNLLEDHIVDVDVLTNNLLHVNHAY